MGLSKRVVARSAIRMRRSRGWQMGILTGVWLLSEGLVRLLRLPVPSGVIGMGLVLLLLASGRMRPSSMRRGADCFLEYMLLFFVPAVLVLLDHPEFLSWLGLKLLVLIMTSTVLVMGGTALSVELYFRWRVRHAHE